MWLCTFRIALALSQIAADFVAFPCRFDTEMQKSALASDTPLSNLESLGSSGIFRHSVHDTTEPQTALSTPTGVSPGKSGCITGGWLGKRHRSTRRLSHRSGTRYPRSSRPTQSVHHRRMTKSEWWARRSRSATVGVQSAAPVPHVVRRAVARLERASILVLTRISSSYTFKPYGIRVAA